MAWKNRSPQKQDEQDSESRLEKFAGGAFYGLFVAGLATAAAVAATFVEKDITASWPFVWPWPGLSALKAGVVFFWVTLAGWAVFYFLREHVKGKQVKRLYTSASDIKESVQTLPPSDFVKDYAGIVSRAHRVMGRVLPRQRNPDPNHPTSDETLTRAIRGLLQNLAVLASTYDSRTIDYGANVMVFVAQDSKSFSSLDKQKINRYLSPGFDYANLKGVLHLRTELAVINSAEGTGQESIVGEESSASGKPVAVAPAKAQEGIYEVIFGIPKDEYARDEVGRSRVLPGSPTAYATAAVHYEQDFANLRAQESGRPSKYDLDPDVLKHLEDDYGENGAGKMVRSFLAFPLIAEDSTVVGTLNIHCGARWILGHQNEGRIANFVAVVAPLVNNVAALVSIWSKTP